MKETVVITENEVFIDPKDIPLSVKETACRVLASSIRLALADPVKRAEYEEWLAKRTADNEKQEKRK